MSNKDFDIDFDFDEAYGFDDDADGKQEAYDDNTNPEILSRRSSGGSFDADGDLDDFLNMGSAPQVSQESQAPVEPEEDEWAQDGDFSEAPAQDGSYDQTEEVDYGDPGEYDEGVAEDTVYDEEDQGEYPEDGEEEDAPKKPKKQIKLPKLKMTCTLRRCFTKNWWKNRWIRTTPAAAEERPRVRFSRRFTCLPFWSACPSFWF